jgi:hypothetical protein
MVAACGYPKQEPTHIFTHIALALILRERQLELYIAERFLKCGQQAGAWLHRCLEDARRPAKVPEKAKKYTAPVTRGSSKRRREVAGVL